MSQITITGRPGRILPMRGSASSPLPSGMMTSEMTRSPFPSSTQRISVIRDEVAWTLQPARVSATTYTATCVHLNDTPCNSRTETYTPGGTY